MTFADVTLNQIRILSKTAGALLSFTTKRVCHLYYVNQGPVIFRSVLKLDSNAFLFLQNLPTRIELRNNLNSNTRPEDVDTNPKEEINTETEDFERFVRNNKL